MLNKLLIFFILFIGGMVTFHHLMQTGELLTFLDAHPDERFVPAVEYYVGQGYYLFQDPEGAITYFQRVVDRYPHSRWADDAAFSRIDCMEDSPSVNRATLIDEYQKYSESFPSGKNLSVAENRIDAYRTGSR